MGDVFCLPSRSSCVRRGDLGEAFAANPAAEVFFATLSNNLQRYHVDGINGAKAADTRQRRVDKSIGLFLQGKQR